MGKVNFKSVRSLKRVNNLVEAADKALKDKTLTVTTAFFLNTVVLSSLTAVASTVAAPIVAPIAAVGGLIAARTVQNRALKLREEKERLYNLAIQKQQAIIDELRVEIDSSEKRIEYLESINGLLQDAIDKLKEDLNNERSLQV